MRVIVTVLLLNIIFSFQLFSQNYLNEELKAIDSLFSQPFSSGNDQLLLLKIKSLQPILFKKEDSKSERNKKTKFICNKYIQYADSLLAVGYDPNKDYSKIACFGWSRIILVDTTIKEDKIRLQQHEEARMNNEKNCREYSKYGQYIRFCESFDWFFLFNVINFEFVKNCIEEYCLKNEGRNKAEFLAIFAESSIGKDCRKYQR